jgi:hypothetical protein
VDQEDIDRFVQDGRLTSDYGSRDLDGDGIEEDFHEGNDIGPPNPGESDVEVNAGVEGTVTFSGGNYGTVAVETEDGSRVRYLHLDDINLEVGDDVNPDTVVGTMGGRGPNGPNQYPTHLHIDVQNPNNNWVDPAETDWDNFISEEEEDFSDWSDYEDEIEDIFNELEDEEDFSDWSDYENEIEEWFEDWEDDDWGGDSEDEEDFSDWSDYEDEIEDEFEDWEDDEDFSNWDEYEDEIAEWFSEYFDGISP